MDQLSSILQTSDNKIWIVWEREQYQGWALFYQTSSDFGISWSDPQNLTIYPNDDMNQAPSITQLSNGTIMVVWSALRYPPPEPDFNLSAHPSSLTIPVESSNTSTVMVTSTGGFNDTVDLAVKSIIPPFGHNISTSFDPPQVTPPPDGNANSTLTITVGAGTTPTDYTVVVTGYSESLNKTKSTNIALTVAETMESTASSSSCAMPLSESLPPEPDYEIYCKVSHDNGSSWSTAVKLVEDPGDDRRPSVTQASNGTIWLAWASDRSGMFYDIFYKTFNGSIANQWSNDTQLTFDDGVDAFPGIAQMKDGKMWVVWHTSRHAAGMDFNLEIYYKTYDGSSWFADTRLTNTAKDIDDTVPAILQTANETMWIFWASEGWEQPPYIFYEQSFDNGTNWTEENFNVTTGLEVDRFPATTQTCDSRIWVIFTSMRDDNDEIYYKTSLIRNVAVANLTLSQGRVYQGETVSVNVTVQNRGNYNESFTVACYANSTLIDSEIVTLDPLTESTNVTFAWNTSGFARGNYYVKAEASPVSGELYTEDNTLSTGPVRVKLLGDVNDDGTVDQLDICELSDAYGSVAGDPNWNEEADINGDNMVDVYDSYILSNNYGKTD